MPQHKTNRFKLYFLLLWLLSILIMLLQHTKVVDFTKKLAFYIFQPVIDVIGYPKMEVETLLERISLLWGSSPAINEIENKYINYVLDTKKLAELKQEVAYLKNILQLRNILIHKINKADIIPVRVLTKASLSDRVRYFINAGRSDGLKGGEPFVSFYPQIGIDDVILIGIVSKVLSSHISEVVPIYDSNLKIVVRPASSDIIATLECDSLRKLCRLLDIPSETKLKLGEFVYSVGGISKFPDNILVGRVTSTTLKKYVASNEAFVEPLYSHPFTLFNYVVLRHER